MAVALLQPGLSRCFWSEVSHGRITGRYTNPSGDSEISRSFANWAAGEWASSTKPGRSP